MRIGDWSSDVCSSDLEHQDGVARSGLADRLDDVARQGSDIGAAVAADLGFVVHAAQADARELPPGRPCDALAQRRLADAGRADEAQDRALAVGPQLADREILQYPQIGRASGRERVCQYV